MKEWLNYIKIKGISLVPNVDNKFEVDSSEDYYLLYVSYLKRFGEDKSEFYPPEKISVSHQGGTKMTASYTGDIELLYKLNQKQ